MLFLVRASVLLAHSLSLPAALTLIYRYHTVFLAFDPMMPLERRQPELISAILLSEHAEEEAVHAEQHATPQEDSELLSPRVSDSGHLKC